MCFISTIIKIKEDTDSLYPIVKLLTEAQKDNPHGTGDYCFNKSDDAINYYRAMEQTIEEIAGNVTSFDVCNYHFRQATEGLKDVSNVHYWKYNNWLFAHNGIISNMAKEEKSDSLVFFENICEQGLLEDDAIDIVAIKKYTNSVSFGGRFMLINSDNKNIYYFGDWNVYLLNEAYLIIASSRCDFESAKNVLGIDFVIETDIETMDTEIDGIWKYDPKKGFKQLELKLKEYSNYHGYNYGYNINGTHTAIIPSEPDGDQEGLATHITNGTEAFQKDYDKLTEKFEAEYQRLSLLPMDMENIKAMEKIEEEYYFELQDLEEMHGLEGVIIRD